MVVLFPPFHAGWVVWLVFIPLLSALWSLGEKRRKRKAFGLGFLAGLAFFLGSLMWLRTVTDAGWIALSVYLALFPALWAAFAAGPARPRAGDSIPGSLRGAFCVAAVWCGLEWLRGWLFTGFGWNGIGVAFHETPVFAQSADLLGICGLSFLPIFVQAVIVRAAIRRLETPADAVRRPSYDLGFALILVAAALGYGRWRMSTAASAESIRLKALLVQLNIPQDATQMLWSPTEIHFGYEDETLAALDELEGRPQPDWIVWPESSLNGRILRGPKPGKEWAMGVENWQTIERVAPQSNRTFVLGLNEMEGESLDGDLVMKEDPRVWNSLAVIQPGSDLQTFRKHHLVIFGEYIPLVDKLPFLAKIYEQQSGAKFGGSLSVGDSLEPLTAKVGTRQLSMIPTVCFEDSVGRLVRKFVRSAPQVIVNVTNDGWFKTSAGAEQHFANARFRAIELRRPLLRCANTGVSAAVDTTGRTGHPDTGKRQELRDSSGSTFTRGHLLAEVDVPLHPGRTLYALVGDWGVIGAALLGLGFAKKNKKEIRD